MSGKKEVKSQLEQVKELASVKHPDIRFITTAAIEGSKNITEYAIATETGLFFYLFKKDQLQTLTQVMWKDVKEIKVDFLAMSTNLTLNGQNFRLMSEGKKVFNLAVEKSDAEVEKVDRKWYQKILGFRSGTRWKRNVAVVTYLILIGFIGTFFLGQEETKNLADEEKNVATETKESENREENQAVIVKRDKLSDEEQAAEVKRIADMKVAEEKKKAEEAAAADEEKKLAEEKEAQKDTAILESFNEIRTEMISQGSGVIDMDIAKDPNYYQIKVIVDENVWANSTESQKMSFVTSLSTIVENQINETLYYDVYSNFNEDLVATEGAFGKWKIKR